MIYATIGILVLILIFVIAACDIWYNLETDPDGSRNFPFFGTTVLILGTIVLIVQSGLAATILKGLRILGYMG